jgi:TRPM family ion channel
MRDESSEGYAALDAILARAAEDPDAGWPEREAIALARDTAESHDESIWAQWLLRVLALARGAPRDVGEVPGHETPIRDFDAPVAIVAGEGGPQAGSDFASTWDAILGEAFGGFSGTVVSGGTTTGVPGVVGRVVGAACARCRVIGYLPRGAVERGDARISTVYDEIRTTGGERFSALEPLATWRDVLASEIAPRDVMVLGIGGGRVSGFEYRLAGLLGARVGLVEGSGRAADELLRDAGSGPGAPPAALRADAGSVAAFLGRGA